MEQTPAVSKSAQGRKWLPWWKRTWIVNRKFQFKFAASAVILGVISSAVASIMILWSFWAFNIWRGERLPLPVLLVIGFVMCLNVGAIYVVGIMATQKIVGPLFNLMRQFQRVAAGDYQVRARFRSSDEIHYVGRRFNQMMESLEKKDAFILDQCREARGHLERGDISAALHCIHEIVALKEDEQLEEAKRKVLQVEEVDGD